MSGIHLRTGFPDLPIDGSGSEDNRDLLGLEQHAEALAGFIEMCSTPMTIGIQGDWGSGKTSLMNFVRARLGNERALNIWFNTWQYAQFGNEDQLASSMLVNLMQKIKSVGEPSKKVWHHVSRFIRSVVQASTVEKGGLTLTGKSLLDAIEGRGEFDDAGLFERMKEDFGAVIKDILEQGKVERVVIYIDDLDRLAPKKAVELLEATKNLIDVEGCVFVLAIDYDVVIRGLRQRKGYDAGEFREIEGKNFFDKIIQVPYRMPVERYTTQNFLKSHFERVYGKLSDYASEFFEEWAEDLIHLSVGNNPRGLKRALNIHALFSHLMRIGREDEIGDNERIVTLVLACIQVALPQMYSLLARRRSPFFTLVSLRTPEVYNLLDREDEAEEFERVAASISEAILKLRGLTDDEDDDGVEQAADELRLLVGDLRRFESSRDEGTQKRIRRLAGIALQAIDVDGNGIYSQDELEALDTALSVTSSTSVEAEQAEQAEESRAPARRNVGFKELAECMDVFAKHPKLVFWDPVAEEYDENIKRVPDYDSSVARLHVVVDGARVRLKAETLRILELREERGGREMTARERSGRISAANYWVVENDDEERTVATLRKEWKTIQGREVDTRTPAGRDAYNARVLGYIRSCEGEFVPARQVQEQVGGTMSQLRAALNRLIERGQITYQGRARGTRYAMA